MPALNFKEEFVPDVEAGIKQQSIRGGKKRGGGSRFKVGDTVFLYTGMRTKQCRKLGMGKCVSVQEILIAPYCNILQKNLVRFVRFPTILIENISLSIDECISLAIEDGFKGRDEFFDFFSMTYKLKGSDYFSGYLIKWEPVDE